jgi:hypothetical protein
MMTDLLQFIISPFDREHKNSKFLYKFQPIQEKVADTEDINHLSLEETKAKTEYDKKIAMTNQKKQCPQELRRTKN